MQQIQIVFQMFANFSLILILNSLKIYEKYSRLLSKLSNETLDRLSTPATWNLTNFKKTFILRSNLVSAKKPFVTTKNSLMWLNLLIDNSCNNSDSNA